MSRPNATEVAGRLLALRSVVAHALAMPTRDLLDDWFTKWTEVERNDFTQKSDAAATAYWTAINRSPIFPYFTAWEREFAKTRPLTVSRQRHIEAMWRAEAAQVLMWALQLIPQLPSPDEQAGPGFLKSEQLGKPAAFLVSARLRTEREIAQAREIAELWYWRSRTEQLIRERSPFPQQLTKQGFRSFQDLVRAAVTAAHQGGAVQLVVDGDFMVKGKAYSNLSPEELSEVQSISLERHRGLNWLCGESPANEWDSTPTDT
jgi:hypothetical protein